MLLPSQIHQESVHKEIKYKCNECDNQFTQKGNLKTHQNSVHGGITHKCKECDYQATQKGNFKKHEKSIHEVLKKIFLLKHMTASLGLL